MLSTSTQKTTAAVIVILLLGYFVYAEFFAGSAAPAADTSSVAATPVIGQDILTLVLKLQKISIDSSLFSSDLWARLKDSGLLLSPESQGRVDPFAPIGSDSGTVSGPVQKTSAKTGM